MTQLLFCAKLKCRQKPHIETRYRKGGDDMSESREPLQLSFEEATAYAAEQLPTFTGLLPEGSREDASQCIETVTNFISWQKQRIKELEAQIAEQ